MNYDDGTSMLDVIHYARRKIAEGMALTAEEIDSIEALGNEIRRMSEQGELVLGVAKPNEHTTQYSGRFTPGARATRYLRAFSTRHTQWTTWLRGLRSSGPG